MKKLILKRRRRLIINKNDGVQEFAPGTVLELPDKELEDKHFITGLLAGNNLAEEYTGKCKHLEIDEVYANKLVTPSVDVKQDFRNKQAKAFEDLAVAIVKLTEVNEKILKHLEGKK